MSAVVGVGSLFVDKASFRLAVTNQAVEDMRKLLFPINDKDHMKAVCKDKNCGFFINARIDQDGKVRVSSCCLEHACNVFLGNTGNGPWFAERADDLLAYQPNAVPVDFIRRMKLDHGMDLSYPTAHNILARAKERAAQGGRSSFGLIVPWLEKIRDINPGTVIDYVRDRDDRIVRFFFSFKAWREAFNNSLPVLSLDAAHMKCKEGGMVFLASVLTANRDICVIACAFGLTEDGEHWSWFIQNLLKDNPALTQDDIVILSDREKGLHSAVDTLLPSIPHSLCSVHLKRNVKTNFKTDLKGKIHLLAKTLSVVEAESILAECALHNAAATEYVKGM